MLSVEAKATAQQASHAQMLSGGSLDHLYSTVLCSAPFVPACRNSKLSITYFIENWVEVPLSIGTVLLHQCHAPQLVGPGWTRWICPASVSMLRCHASLLCLTNRARPTRPAPPPPPPPSPLPPNLLATSHLASRIPMSLTPVAPHPQ